MTLRLTVDGDVCIGSGNCVHAAPGAFELDGDGIAQVEPAAAELGRDEMVDVARACPSGAIEVFDGDEQVDIFAS